MSHVVKLARQVYSIESRDGNALLELLHARSHPQTFKFVTELYTVIYFSLLVEEFAVARMVVAKLAGGNAVATATLVSTIAFVVFTYLYAGGFRAVVGADFVQTAVLGSFVVILLFLTLRDNVPSVALVLPSEKPSPLQLANTVGAMLFGIGWFVAAIDYYSRLNFAHSGRSNEDGRLLFSSLLSVAVILIIGTLFGSALQPRVQFTSTVAYVDRAIDYFVHESTAIAALFITAVFSMIFTTLDTLMVSALQTGAYQRKTLFRRETLLNMVLIALVVSTQIPASTTGVLGVFLGSLMALPTLAICRVTWPRLFVWLPEGPAYLVAAITCSILIFGGIMSTMEPHFELHFLMTFGVWAIAIICGISFRMAELITRSFARR